MFQPLPPEHTTCCKSADAEVLENFRTKQKKERCKVFYEKGYSYEKIKELCGYDEIMVKKIMEGKL